MKSLSDVAVVLVVAMISTICFSLVAATSASAKIRCKGPNQIVGGQLIPTPYCSDGYIAQVARSYGFKYSARDMRRSFSKKQEVCRLIGQDIRVIDYCRSALPYQRGRGF